MYVNPKKPSKTEQEQRARRDLDAIRRFRRGEQSAFDELVRAYQTQVQRIVTQLNAPPSELEDLTQEVFLRVFRNLRYFRGQSSFYTWLYRITINVFFDYNKRRKRADVRLARLQQTMTEASALPAFADDPYRACCETLSREQLAGAIGALPESFRAVVSLRELADLSYEEIAVRTGISIGTVRSRLSRARIRLKELLRPVLLPAA